MVHGPDIESETGEHVHGRILTLARYRQVVAGAGGIRGAVDEEQRRLRFASFRRDALAVKGQFHAALLRPMLARLDIGLSFSVRAGHKADNSVFTQIRSQPEFNQQLWQYINRRVSDWRIQAGQDRAKTYAPLLARIEKDFGVERGVILGLWGIESTFGDPIVQQNRARPVFPSLAALAWGEPRRRAYW